MENESIEQTLVTTDSNQNASYFDMSMMDSNYNVESNIVPLYYEIKFCTYFFFCSYKKILSNFLYIFCLFFNLLFF